MPNSNVLVHGTGGATLRDSNGCDTGYPLRMQLDVTVGTSLSTLDADALIELLSMDHRPGQLGPARTTLKPGISLLPGQVLDAAYNQIPSTFNRYLYDWRADMRWNAGNLLSYLVDRRPTNGRWNIVAHSQGGCLVALASKLYADSGASFDDLAASVVLVGVPLGGTINATRAILLGDQMGPATEPAFRHILRTWPALFQMFPAWPAVVDSSGNYGGVAQLTDPFYWGGDVGVHDMLERARAAQQLLADPLSAITGNTRLAVYMAVNRPTSSHYCAAGTQLVEIATSFVPGDTLVPETFTAAFLGTQYLPYLRLLQGNIAEHAFLLTDGNVGSSVLREIIP
jgi:pimeloyl-ACP methyl ester carboxylesterase